MERSLAPGDTWQLLLPITPIDYLIYSEQLAYCINIFDDCLTRLRSL